MSSLDDGVFFAINATHKLLYPTSWPAKGSKVAFVVRLPSDYTPSKPYTFDGANLFGNFTAQPPPAPGSYANGYAALAVWDLVKNGGNGDGLISMGDEAVQLGIRPGGIVLWMDDDHDGVAQPQEIHTFSEMGLVSIDVARYHPSHWSDKVGNKFTYSAPVTLSTGNTVSSFDVFFVLGFPKKGD